MCGKNTTMNTLVPIPVTMVTSNDHLMILFTTAHVLHIPIEYDQKRFEDKDVNVYMGH